MQLKICHQCKRPFMASNEFCPHCPAPYDADSWTNLGCIVLTILPLFVMIFFWLFFFMGIFIK